MVNRFGHGYVQRPFLYRNHEFYNRTYYYRGRPYALPAVSDDYAGSVLCLSHTAEPDTSAFDAPEIVHRMKKHHHAGLIVRSHRPQRVAELLEDYSSRFAEMFLATMPAPERPTA